MDKTYLKCQTASMGIGSSHSLPLYKIVSQFLKCVSY